MLLIMVFLLKMSQGEKIFNISNYNNGGRRKGKGGRNINVDHLFYFHSQLVSWEFVISARSQSENIISTISLLNHTEPAALAPSDPWGTPNPPRLKETNSIET